LTARRLGIAGHHAIGRGEALRQAERLVTIGSVAGTGEPGNCRHGENKTQAPQDSLPFAFVRSQHNAISANLEHAQRRAPDCASQKIGGLAEDLSSRSAADRYALRM
jgi:hypothetical protein